MPVLLPASLDEVRDALRAYPDAHLLAGGTDYMVECNAGHQRPSAVIALRRCVALRDRIYDGDRVFLGAGATYRDLAAPDVAAAAPALTQAARTVGSPQIRNAGTIGGNIATGSPAGDTLPVLVALDADVHLLRVDGATRVVGWREFFVGPKRTSRRSDEVIVGTSFLRTVGPQEYLKVGTRNAMVISVAGLALVVDIPSRSVRVGLGSVGPTPLRADEAEAWVVDEFPWPSGPGLPASGLTPDARSALTRAFGERVAQAAKPIDDHRSTASYRRHAVRVLATRALRRAIESLGEHRGDEVAT